MRAPESCEVEAAIARLGRALAAWGAVKVIVHGSAARGDYFASSDIDLIVVRETPKRMPERIAEAIDQCQAAASPLPVEPLVYTPAEFAALVAADNPLIAEAIRTGRVVHDQA